MNASPDARLHLDHWRIFGTRFGLAFLIFILVLGVAGAFNFFTPKQYSSSATIEVAPSFGNENSERGNQSKVTEAQFESLLGQSLLASVVRHADLQKKWARNGTELQPQAASDRLLRMTEVRREPPNRIYISVLSTDPQEAQLLANAIAQEYIDQRTLEQKRLFEKALNGLPEIIEQKEKSVDAAFAKASRLRTEAGYLDPNPDSKDVSTRVAETVAPNQEKIKETLTHQISSLKFRVAGLDRIISGADPIGFFVLDRDSAQNQELSLNFDLIEQKLPLYQNALAEKTRLLSSGLGQSDPEVQAIQRQIDTIEGELRQNIANIRKGLVAQTDTAEDSLRTLQTISGTDQIDQKRKEANAGFLEAKQQYDLARQALEAAKAQLDAKTAKQAKSPRPAVIVEPAKTAMSPIHAEGPLNLPLAAAAGLVLGAGSAYLLERSGNTIKKPQDVEHRLGLPLLAAIPKNSSQPLRPKPEKPGGQPYQILKTNVDLARRKAAASVLTVVSAGAGEGKSTTSANLATLYAASELQTLIVDAAQHRPTQHDLLDLDNRVGLSEYFAGEKAFDEIIQSCRSPNLFVITSGSLPTPTSFDARKLGKLVAIAKDWFDVVIFDCSPVLGVSDAPLISALADGTILVAKHRRFPCSMIAKTKDALQKLGTKILGVVLTNGHFKYDPKRLLPKVAAPKRPNEEFKISEFENSSEPSTWR